MDLGIRHLYEEWGSKLGIYDIRCLVAFPAIGKRIGMISLGFSNAWFYLRTLCEDLKRVNSFISFAN